MTAERIISAALTAVMVFIIWILIEVNCKKQATIDKLQAEKTTDSISDNYSIRQLMEVEIKETK